jgi:hypothetical protein
LLQNFTNCFLLANHNVPNSYGVTPEAAYFTDFPYRQVFQVNVPFLETMTGLHFTWRGVKQLDVPMEKLAVNKINRIENAKDAKGGVTRGMAIPGTNPVTVKTLREDKYITSMILP